MRCTFHWAAWNGHILPLGSPAAAPVLLGLVRVWGTAERAANPRARSPLPQHFECAPVPAAAPMGSCTLVSLLSC